MSPYRKALENMLREWDKADAAHRLGDTLAVLGKNGYDLAAVLGRPRPANTTPTRG